MSRDTFSGFKSLPLPNLSVESQFGPRPSMGRNHKGIDLNASPNTNVFAVADGEVIFVGVEQDATGKSKGYGLYVRINHGPVSVGTQDIQTTYAHLTSVDTQKISVGKRVKAGDIIGKSGGAVGDPNAGGSTGPHLHFEIQQGNFKIDPLPFLNAINTRIDAQFVTQQVIASGQRMGTQRQQARVAGARRAAGTGAAISPYIASLDSFHPSIQYELTKRSYATNTVQTHMPFVRLTSLSTVLRGNSKAETTGTTTSTDQPSSVNDEIGALYCPSIGPHGEPRIDFEDIYTPQDNRSVIGYATTIENELPKRVPVIVDNTADESDAPNIPMPGITSMTTERSTAGPLGTRGGLFKANLKIMAHSVGQLNGLLRYFLRPATRVILEFGRMSSNPDEEIVPFNWNRSKDEIIKELGPLVTATQDQRKFIEKYVYGSKGNYDIFIGYVVNFKLNYTGKNTYEIDLTVHSIQQFEVPVRLTGARSLCSTSIIDNCKVLDISGYFNPDENWRYNTFDALLNKVGGANPEELRMWKPDVIQLKPTDDKQSAAHLVSWRFFTDVVLNDDKFGLRSIFQLEDTDIDTLSLLSKSLLTSFEEQFLETQPDKLVNAQVSWHKSLRSTDPGVMVIYNKTANTDTEEVLANLKTTDKQLFNIISTNNTVGDFGTLEEDNTEIEISSLYTGVWINTSAIRKAFDGADTLSVALNKLLMFMNSATEGYWNLQLLSNDTDSPGVHVVDMGLSKPIKKTVRESTPSVSETTIVELQVSKEKPDEPAYLYQFNRKTRRFQADDIGSELLDIKLEASLPQVIAVQAIAGVGGVGQQGTWNAIDIDELRRITLFEGVYPNCSTPARTCAGGTNTELEKIDKELTQLRSVVIPSGERPGLGIDARIQNLEAQREKLIEKQNPNFANLAKNYLNSFGAALAFIENDKTDMARKLSDNAEGRTTHPFNSSNLTKTTVDLTLPGIGGIQLFQSFSVARVPNILDRGYYIVTKINHEFTLERGWITKIQGRFRYKPSESDRLRRTAVTTPTPEPSQRNFANMSVFNNAPLFPTNTQSPFFRP